MKYFVLFALFLATLTLDCEGFHASDASSFGMRRGIHQMHIPSKNSKGKLSDITSIWKSVALAVTLLPSVVFARPEGVNKPNLLPKEFSTVIDVANYLTKGQEKQAAQEIDELEKQTGFKLRILAQSYPNTPGLAIKDYWKVDDNTVVVVFDKGEGFNRKGIPSNFINLNIGKAVEEVLPSMFWTRLNNKLGNQPYIKKVGEDTAILNTVQAITYCLEIKDCKDLPFSI